MFDDNLILDDAQINNEDPVIPEQMALALTNALFKVTQPNGCLLFGSLSEDFTKVEKGFLFLTFGLLAYIPTLPDPYAANLGILRQQIRGRRIDASGARVSSQQLTAWLVCRIAWDVPSDDTDNDEVVVSFHFAPINNQFAGISFDEPESEEDEPLELDSATPTPGLGPVGTSGSLDVAASHGGSVSRLAALNLSESLSGNTGGSSPGQGGNSESGFTTPISTSRAVINPDSVPLPDYESQWDKETLRYSRDLFALLDVSTNADLFGVSFDLLSRRDFRVSTNVDTSGEAVASFFPVQVNGMDVVSAGANVKAFTVPQISWEPVFNLSPPAPPPDGPIAGDPCWRF